MLYIFIGIFNTLVKCSSLSLLGRVFDFGNCAMADDKISIERVMLVQILLGDLLILEGMDDMIVARMVKPRIIDD